jgi:hypothetical protein
VNANDVKIMMQLLTAAYPNSDLQPVTAEAYLRELRDVDSEDMAPALDQWVRTQTRMPTIADLREGAANVRRRRLVKEAPLAPPSGKGFMPDAEFLRACERGYVSMEPGNVGAAVGPIRRDVLKGLFRREIWPEEWDDEPPTRPIVRAMP